MSIPSLPAGDTKTASRYKQPSDIGQAHVAAYHRFAFIKDGHAKKSSALEAAVFALFRIIMSASFGIIIGSVIAPFHHLIGAFAAILLFIAAMAGSRRAYGLWQGDCPHCKREIWIRVGRSALAFNCPICTRRILLSNEQFEAV